MSKFSKIADEIEAEAAAARKARIDEAAAQQVQMTERQARSEKVCSEIIDPSFRDAKQVLEKKGYSVFINDQRAFPGPGSAVRSIRFTRGTRSSCVMQITVYDEAIIVINYPQGGKQTGNAGKNIPISDFNEDLVNKFLGDMMKSLA